MLLAVYLAASVSLFTALSGTALSAWLRYADTELYSYLYITPLVFLLMLLFIMNKRVLRPDVLSGAAAAFIAATALTAVVYGFETFYIEQALILAYLMLLYAVLVAVSGRHNFRRVLVLAPLLLLMVPPPQYYVYLVSSHLTNIVGRLAYQLAAGLGTHISLIDRYGVLVARVTTVSGRDVYFEIAPICSGVIGFLSVAAVSPLIAYIGYRGSRSLMRRAVGAAAGIASLAALMFISNILRLAMVFYMTYRYGYDVGYGLFHYTPEIVLILPVTYISMRIVELIAGKYTLDIGLPRLGVASDILTWGLLVAFILPAASGLISLNVRVPDAVFVHTVEGPPSLLMHGSDKPEPLITSNITGFSIEYVGREHAWEQSLGTTTRVHFYRAKYGNKTLFIYIEFSRKPSQIHMWELCLWWQNISVYRSVFINYYDSRADYAMLVDNVYYGKGYLQGTLIYWRDIVYTENGLEYFRATIMYNRYDGRNVTEDEVALVNRTAFHIWYRAIMASYARTGFGVDIKQALTLASATEAIIAAVALFIKYAPGKIPRITSVLKRHEANNEHYTIPTSTGNYIGTSIAQSS